MGGRRGRKSYRSGRHSSRDGCIELETSCSILTLTYRTERSFHEPLLDTFFMKVMSLTMIQYNSVLCAQRGSRGTVCAIPGGRREERGGSGRDRRGRGRGVIAVTCEQSGDEIETSVVSVVVSVVVLVVVLIVVLIVVLVVVLVVVLTAAKQAGHNAAKAQSSRGLHWYFSRRRLGSFILSYSALCQFRFCLYVHRMRLVLFVL